MYVSICVCTILVKTFNCSSVCSDLFKGCYSLFLKFRTSTKHIFFKSVGFVKVAKRLVRFTKIRILFAMFLQVSVLKMVYFCFIYGGILNVAHFCFLSTLI